MTSHAQAGARERKSNTGLRNALTILLIATLFLSLVSFAVYRYWLHPRAQSAQAAIAVGQYRVAKKYYLQTANKGDPIAQNGLGNLYYLGLGVTADRESASKWYFQAASQGYGPAQINLANLYSQGLGVPVDAMRAFAWYKMSHISGVPIAESYLTQIATEYKLSPLQINTVANKWPTLPLLVAEGLN